MSEIRIAVDAMGGDIGYKVTVPAALKTLKKHPNLYLYLVGNEELIVQELSYHSGWDKRRVKVKHASQVITMDESPSFALRGKKDSSMRVALDLVKSGEAAGCVSAGNTGALMAISRFVLKMLPGVDRPAILSQVPSMVGKVHVLDLGANVDSQAEHLLQFAVMGSILVAESENILHPKVGLLNVGKEAIKGTEQVKKAAKLLENSDLNYIGFVEGDDVYTGMIDVIVCDGFVGNVALKTSEGLAKMILAATKKEFRRNWYTKISAILAKGVLSSLRDKFDPGQYNGGSLLGLQGVVIKSHGNAMQDAFATAINCAVLEVAKNIPEKIKNSVSLKLGKPIEA